MNGSIAVAVDQPAGPLSWLDAIPSAHFGSCSGFAIVDWQDGQARSATVVAAPPHEEGGCMSRVRLLAGQGGGPIRPSDCESLTFLHEIPVAPGLDADDLLLL